MKTETSLKRRDETRGVLAGLISQATHCSMTSESIESQRREKLQFYAKGTPYWVKAYLDGYWKAQIDLLYRDHLVFGCFIDNVFHSAHSSRDDYYEKLGKSPMIYADESDNGTRGHYWSHSKKPFFIGSVTPRKTVNTQES